MKLSARKSPAVALLLISLVVAGVFTGYPLYVIRPFRPQGARELAAALAMIQARALVELACVVCGLAAWYGYWSQETRRSKRIWAAVGAGLLCVFAVGSRINVFEIMFHPDTHPAFAPVAETHLDADDMVLAIKLGAAARAYPIREMGYHHVINDWLDGKPVVATY
jgi:hypothetical protein